MALALNNGRQDSQAFSAHDCEESQIPLSELF